MKLLILVAILISPALTGANELPPGLDLDNEQKTRKVLGEWILGIPYEPRLRKDQEFFQRYHSPGVLKSTPSKEYNPANDSSRTFIDRELPVKRIISSVFSSMGFRPDFSDARPNDLEQRITLNSKSNNFEDILNYLELITNLQFTIYPREAGGLVFVRSKNDNAE